MSVLGVTAVCLLESVSKFVLLINVYISFILDTCCACMCTLYEGEWESRGGCVFVCECVSVFALLHKFYIDY